MFVEAKTIFYIWVGATWAMAIIFWRKLKEIAARFWSVLVTKCGHKSGLKNLCAKFVEKIGQKLVKWPLSAHF